MKKFWLMALVLLLAAAPAVAQKAKADSRAKPAKSKTDTKKDEPRDPLSAGTFTGLGLRALGPASTSGRIGDLAVDPRDKAHWYVAVASGGVWETRNAGTTWTPIFDDQGSYSIGCVTLDPRNPLTVWIGTGENNSQRSVGYGDGVYRSLDGGKTWENLGLKQSEHIGRILVDPRNSNVVFVAAQGPLWGPGGDRGLYRSTDGGKTWEKSLDISEHTGVSDIAFDPRDPDTIYASAYQRRRHVWTLIDGGPESAIHKSTDGGKSWRKLTSGLPAGDVGRIGLAVAPSQPDLVYAIVEAADEGGGFYRSTDAGGNWAKMSGYVSGSPQYYQEIIVDPRNADRVYSLDTFMMVTDDGGRTFRHAGEKNKHVDNHALWIDPDDSDHLLVGCDGGLYESFERAASWRFVPNLPVTQFYRVTVDNTQPFYHIYGGTQDNFSLGGPSRTISASGIVNSDWYVTQGGDGFKTQVDPEDPNLVYAQYQHAGLARFDKRSGEGLDIQPQPRPGEPGLRWNWDSPLIISPHLHTRLYFAANIVFRSDDRGDSWRPVSPDLTRRIDRNRLPVMDRVWSIDAVAKNKSTSIYGNIVALTESPRRDGLLYVGTDDGLIQVTEDGGGAWTRYEKFPGVPADTYVSCLYASRHAEGRLYAAFDNHKMADFQPYVLRSDDRGRTWNSVAGDLPERGSVNTVVEDPVNPDLLFAGTEFGLYFTIDGGRKWVQLKGGMPVIAVKDLSIQERETDLAVASFGRGFFILDDYTPLRLLRRETLDREGELFPVRRTWMYLESTPLGGTGKGEQGDGFFTAPNPPFGAVFTWYLKEEAKTLKQLRQDREKKLREAKQPIPYPTWDELRAEENEEAPTCLLTVRDATGAVVRRIPAPAKAGFQRIAWDLRFPPADPVELNRGEAERYGYTPNGSLAAPGTYSVLLELSVRGESRPLGAPQTFECAPLGNATLAAADRTALAAFCREVADLQRAILGAAKVCDETQSRLDHARRAIQDTPGADPVLLADVRALQNRLRALRIDLEGDATLARREEPVPSSITDRVQRAVSGLWSSTAAPTRTHRDEYGYAVAAFPGLLTNLRTLVETDLKRLEDKLDAAGAPWTPGRLPEWPRQ